MYYQPVYDRAAGTHRVIEFTADDVQSGNYSNQYGHESQYGNLCSSREELDALIAELRGPDVWAVFENRAAGLVYVSKENVLTGNWRGSREGHATLVGEFPRQEDAEAWAADRRAYFARA